MVEARSDGGSPVRPRPDPLGIDVAAATGTGADQLGPLPTAGDLDAPITPSRSRWRLLGFLGAGVGVIALYLWDDILFAAPILGATRWWGPGLAFVVLTPVYFSGSVLLSLLAIRAYEHAVAGRTSRLERWLENQARGRRGRLGDSVMKATSAVSFVAASVLLGAVLTTWMIRYSGRRKRMLPVVLASSAIFAVGFVGMYSGLFGLLS
ncbi:MAG: hypothetical protein JWM05_1414 [Acidimicrobiales bacterium]|nr:hypothetical protein [Acidimicrobiales bacterium]